MNPETETQPAWTLWAVIGIALAIFVFIATLAGWGQTQNKPPISELWQKIDKPALEDDLSSRYGETKCDRESDWTFTCTTSTGHMIFVECSEADDGSCSWRP